MKPPPVRDPGLTLAEQRELLDLVQSSQDRVDRLFARVEALLKERELLLLQLARLARAAA